MGQASKTLTNPRAGGYWLRIARAAVGGPPKSRKLFAATGLDREKRSAYSPRLNSKAGRAYGRGREAAAVLPLSRTCPSSFPERHYPSRTTAALHAGQRVRPAKRIGEEAGKTQANQSREVAVAQTCRRRSHVANRPIAPGKEWCPLPPWDPAFPGAFFMRTGACSAAKV
jgi:hypothetical protein